jgi:hypothetical protein
MRLDELVAHLDELDIEVTIYRWPFSYGKEPWHVKLEKSQDGTKLEVIKTAPSFDEALARAWAAFNVATTKGLPALAAPTATGQLIDDEIPF